MDRIDFESRLSDYIRRELPDAAAREFDDYLAAHPEAAGDVEAARTILELSAGISASEPPAQLLAAARARTLKAIRSEHEQPLQSGFWLALPRPAWMSALAVALVGLFLGVLWRGSSTPVSAHVVQEVRNISSIVMTTALALGAPPKIGDRAPELAIERLLQGPADNDLGWKALRGQAMVLEFWATWCGPCIGAIPHLNELAEEFSDHPIRFLSISDEEESVIEPFLKSQPISGWVGLDLDRSVFRDYAVLGIPATVLVDKEGVIQGVTHPRHVTRTVLHDLIAGRRPDVPEKSMGTLFAVGDDGPEPVFQVLIRPSTSDRSGMSRSHGEIKIISFLPEHILPVAFNAPPGQFLIEAELPNQKYDVVINTAGRQDLLVPVMQRAVSAALGIEAVWESRMVDVYVLRKSVETRLELLPSIEGGYTRVSSGELETSSVKGLAHMVASRLDRPVLDETRLYGSYRIKLQFDPEDEASIAQAIKRSLGLELVQARRQVRLLIVRNSGTSGKIEPWILLGVSVLLVLVPLYVKRRRNLERNPRERAR